MEHMGLEPDNKKYFHYGKMIKAAFKRVFDNFKNKKVTGKMKK